MSTRARLVSGVAAIAVLATGTVTVLTHQGHHTVSASPAVTAPVPVALPDLTPPPAKLSPAPELPDAHSVSLAFADAKRDTGTMPTAFKALPVPSWATAPTEARHHAVEPIGATLGISSTMGGPVTSTDAAMTYKGAPLTLLELERRKAADGTEWVHVLLPVRPNGSTGWVRAADTRQTTTPWQLDVHQAQHALLVWFGTTLVQKLTVAVGAPATYTPNGTFFVDVVVDTGSPAGAYGKWILGLNGFSEVYDTFGDGDALIGIHGTNEPASYGHSVSHGCVRAPNPEVAALARLVPLGTPVHVSA